MTIQLGYIGKVAGENKIKEELTKKGYSFGDKKNIAYGIQFNVIHSDNSLGHIRIFEDGKGLTKLDLSAFLDDSHKKIIEQLFVGQIEVSKPGKIQLPQRFFFNLSEGRTVLDSIKKKVQDKFKCSEIPNKNENVIYLLKIDGVTLLEFNNGTVLIQGKNPSETSDALIALINEIHETNSKKELFRILKFNLPRIKDSEYEVITKELDKYKADVQKYIKNKTYSYLNQNDRIEIRDGILLLEFVKHKKLPIKNYTSLVRNFAVAYEGFLMKWLSELEVFECENIINGKPINVGSYIKTETDGKSALERKHPNISIRKPALAKKLWVYWQECRNDFLHSDFVKMPTLDKIEDAESKIREMISIMEDCLEVTSNITNPDADSINLETQALIGTDEAGKGDYFGPLVIGAVYADEETIKTLSSLGIRDSKLVSDAKIKELYKEITSRCKWDVIKINPDRYNQLYSEIQNLNQLLAWGHARALENMLQKVKCKYALADQFGDENLIKSKLMQQGKTITLIQKPKAETNIAVAAASIVARYTFLEELEKLSRIYGMKLPKGASDKVEKTAKAFAEKKGRSELSKIAKIHFKTTEKIFGAT